MFSMLQRFRQFVRPGLLPGGPGPGPTRFMTQPKGCAAACLLASQLVPALETAEKLVFHRIIRGKDDSMVDFSVIYSDSAAPVKKHMRART